MWIASRIVRILRKIVLASLLGGGRWLGTQLSGEQIEAMLYASNRTVIGSVVSNREPASRGPMPDSQARLPQREEPHS